MQHSAIVQKNDKVIVFTSSHSDMPEIRVFKLSSSFIFSEIIDMNFVILQLADTYYKCGFTAPDEDCYLCIKFADDVAFIRVGEPPLCVFHYTDSADDNITFKQIDAADGRIIASGNLENINNGFYYKKILSQNYSILELASKNGLTPSILKLPYPSINGDPSGPGTGYSAIANFIEIEKLAMIGFLGERKSGFDRTLGKWIQKDTDVTVSDLAKAICYKYSLDWEKLEDESNWIGNYVKYIKTQDLSGAVLIYRPGSTPDNNRNNYPLIMDDILDNIVVRGLAIYLSRPLEIVNDIEGAVFEFRNRS